MPMYCKVHYLSRTAQLRGHTGIGTSVYICQRGFVKYCATETVTAVWHSVAPHVLQYLDRMVLENVFFMYFTGAHTHKDCILDGPEGALAHGEGHFTEHNDHCNMKQPRMLHRMF